MLKENLDRLVTRFKSAFGYEEEEVEYRLNIPPKLYGALEEMAKEKRVKVSEIFRQGLKLYILRSAIEDEGGNLAVIKSDGSTVVIEALTEETQGK
ncbi:hypothetical protein A2V56_03770 [Candidatus Woesebacteria bacterium RBG_19FT_COMBO_42_9]|uniref:Uncharacterized protein n=1 Tax=Candidatus Woesebacteria bacterium RBG_16_42_24 TaxID=1802485 RepID=A0A1F7XKB5_9BACT|nr:MAG: hypothetical protein A2V97_00470 [Candidatus Woesebacteria bacterium RBG_16_42_24]OGM17584.1 MAG: hypothetical protein A2V56_03770 [Candidatus Woesebacteria bacterium RBG_19FT_COMBO_42_9]OGM67091.1 MAG: hypothetical protein A2985_02455 [Candidatus Woesebacteria bacterium RIFCSPLOWO2_01_FULL_43_11]